MKIWELVQRSKYLSERGQSSVPVTISGLFGAGTYTGHGKLLIDGAVAFAPQDLFRELHPEITSFDYSWSIVSDPKKADYVESELKIL